MIDATTILANMLRDGRATANEVRAINDAYRDGVLAERNRCADIAKMFAGYADGPSGNAHNEDAKRLAEDAASWIWTEIMQPPISEAA